MIVNQGPSIKLKAGATVNQNRFVKRGADSAHAIQAAAATDVQLGITDIPGVPGTTAAAEADLEIIVEDGKICELQLGGTVTAGNRLTSNATGQGIATTTTGDFVGAHALEDGVSGDVIKVVKKGYTL